MKCGHWQQAHCWQAFSVSPKIYGWAALSSRRGQCAVPCGIPSGPAPWAPTRRWSSAAGAPRRTGPRWQPGGDPPGSPCSPTARPRHPQLSRWLCRFTMREDLPSGSPCPAAARPMPPQGTCWLYQVQHKAKLALRVSQHTRTVGRGECIASLFFLICRILLSCSRRARWDVM